MPLLAPYDQGGRIGRLELWSDYRARGGAMAAGVLQEWTDLVLPTLIGTALLIVIVLLKTQPYAETMAVYERLKPRVEAGEESSPSGVPEMLRRSP